VTPPRGDVDLEAEGVRGTGETAPGTVAGMIREEHRKASAPLEGGKGYIITGQEGVTADEDELTPSPATNGRGGKRKRVAIQFRGDTIYKTKFLTNVRQLLNEVEDEEEFDQLAADIKAALNSVEDSKDAAALTSEVWPLVEATQADFEQGEEVPEESAPPAKPAAPAADPGELDLAMD
jgi:hypothetical protein